MAPRLVSVPPLRHLVSTQLELPVMVRAVPRQVNIIRDLSDYGALVSPQAERPHVPNASPQATRQSAGRDSGRALRQMAARRLRAVALHREERARLTPEQIADRMTSLYDARIALCIAQGNALDDIDPSSGLSMSRESYERVRQSWRNQAKQPGWCEYLRPDLEKAIAFWAERRPEFIQGDNWLDSPTLEALDGTNSE